MMIPYQLCMGNQCLYPGEENLRDIRIAEAIYKSAQTGEKVKMYDRYFIDCFFE